MSGGVLRTVTKVYEIRSAAERLVRVEERPGSRDEPASTVYVFEVREPASSVVHDAENCVFRQTSSDGLVSAPEQLQKMMPTA
jgi:hypothetical protein